MSDITPADLRANLFRVAVTQDAVCVQCHPEMGMEFESEDGWIMMCAAAMHSLEWPAQWEETQ